MTTAAEAETAIDVALAAASAAVASAEAARAGASAEFYNKDKSSGLVLTHVPTEDGNPKFAVSGTAEAMAKATAALSTMGEATKKAAKAVVDLSIEMTISAILSDVAETYPDVSMTQEYREILRKRLERHVRDLSSSAGCVYDTHMTVAQALEEKRKIQRGVIQILDEMQKDDDSVVEIAPGIYQLALKRAIEKVKYMPMELSPFIKNRRTVTPVPTVSDASALDFTKFITT